MVYEFDTGAVFRNTQQNHTAYIHSVGNDLHIYVYGDDKYYNLNEYLTPISEDEDEATAFEFEGIKVLLDKKAIYVVNQGKLEKQDSVWEFEKHPNRTFRHLMRYGEMVKGENIVQ